MRRMYTKKETREIVKPYTDGLYSLFYMHTINGLKNSDGNTVAIIIETFAKEKFVNTPSQLDPYIMPDSWNKAFFESGFVQVYGDVPQPPLPIIDLLFEDDKYYVITYDKATLELVKYRVIPQSDLQEGVYGLSVKFIGY